MPMSTWMHPASQRTKAARDLVAAVGALCLRFTGSPSLLTLRPEEVKAVTALMQAVALRCTELALARGSAHAAHDIAQMFDLHTGVVTVPELATNSTLPTVLGELMVQHLAGLSTTGTEPMPAAAMYNLTMIQMQDVYAALFTGDQPAPVVLKAIGQVAATLAELAVAVQQEEPDDTGR